MQARTTRVALTGGALVALTGLATGFVPAGHGGAAATESAAAETAAAPGEIRALSEGWSVPWGMDWLPDGSALYTERDTHQVVHLTPDGERTELGEVPGVVSGGEGGLLGLAVSPDFESDQSFFVYHTAEDDNRIARLTFDGEAIGDYEVIFSGIGKAVYHNGGRLKFGPDGYLYATTGDALEPDLAQDPETLEGKILRLTEAGEPAPDNPLDGPVYSYGHRNPQGLAWDDEGRLWSSELGENTWDELNLIEPGGNHGWPLCEGFCADGEVAGERAQDLVDPQEVWPTSEASPSGLAYADGDLYMATMRGQRLWHIPLEGAGTGTPEAYYEGELGRLRTVEAVPGGGALWLSSTNSDSANAEPGQDVVYELTLE